MNTLPRILTLDVAGNPVKWSSYEEVVRCYVKNLIAWEAGRDKYTVRGGWSRCLNERTTIDISSIVAIKGDQSLRHNMRSPLLTNRTLFYRDEKICAYCGESFICGLLSRDHIIPRSQGGKDEWTNVVTSCKRCNVKKSDRTPEQANMPLLYLPYIPSHAEHLLLENHRILADQMEFLKSRIRKNKIG